MPRAYLIFGDIGGKLDVLRVECTKCDRKGRYSVTKLIEKHGRKGNMSKWVSGLKGDCPKRDASALHERCDLICPDLPLHSEMTHPERGKLALHLALVLLLRRVRGFYFQADEPQAAGGRECDLGSVRIELRVPIAPPQ
jgi:hypothetical protein